MNTSRRDFAVAGVLALGASAFSLSGPAAAATADEAALAQSIETLREGVLKQDKAKLDQLAASQISYGHSDGRVETKEQFINGVMNRKPVQKSLAFPELKVFVVGNTAVARHIYLGESELDGKLTSTRIGALQIWQKQGGSWKLLARQGFKLG